MSYTKGQLAKMALSEIGIAEYEFDITAGEQQAVIRKMDAMIATWNRKGILLGYPISKEEDTSPDENSNIPDYAWEAVSTNLAIKIAPSYGKQVSAETRIAARESYLVLVGQAAKPKERQFPSMPKGAGYKTTESRYTSAPKDEYLRDIDNEFDPSLGEFNE